MKEFDPSVTFYSINGIIKKYSGFPLQLPLPVHLQHGWTTIVAEFYAKEKVSENWYWSQWLENQYKEKFKNIKTRTVGSPFLYLLKLVNYQELSKSKRKGSIVFPCHSSKLVQVDCDFEEYASRLEELPEQYKPITICMYYLDLDKGYDKPFVKRGFPVVSNGSRDYKPLGENSFLENFITHTKDKLYAFSNQLGSALFFANTMGLTSFYFGPEINIEVSGSPLYKNININKKLKENKTQFAHYFKFPDCDPVKQTEIVNRELGRDFMLSPAEMRNILWHCTLNKKYIGEVCQEIIMISKLRQLAGKIKRKVLP